MSDIFAYGGRAGFALITDFSVSPQATIETTVYRLGCQIERYPWPRSSKTSFQVRWRLFQTAGKIVRHGRQIFLQIGAAMLDMFAAIRERCARIMREGGAIPETS
jgi:hypothetical protein